MKFDKGILLAGGSGSRLKPLTNLLNKHLLPIYDKPMIFYSLSILMLAKIRKICIVTNKESLHAFENFFQDGKWLGLNITYKIQRKSLGIANGITLCKDFIGKSNFAMCLGDNFFFGSDFTGFLERAQNEEFLCKIFSYEVQNPSEYGVLSQKKEIRIFEKPKKFIGKKIVTGLYFLPNSTIKISNSIRKSKRGEYEITEVLNRIFKSKKIKIYDLKRGITWMDLGTLKSLNKASNFVKIIQENNKSLIGCLEEISLRNKWIKKLDYKFLKKKYGETYYFKYLKNLKK